MDIIAWILGVIIFVIVAIVVLGIAGHAGHNVDKKVFGGFFSRKDY